MKIFRTGIDNVKGKNYHIKHNYSPYCTFQLFQSDIILVQNGTSVFVPKNSIILFSPVSKQDFKSADTTFTNSFVLFSATEKEQKQLVFDCPVQVDNPEYFHTLLSLIHNEFHATTEQGNALDFLLKALLEKAKELFSTIPAPTGANKEITMHNLRTEMLSCAQFGWSIDKIAASCHMSASRFHVVYKEKYGISPMANIIQNRITIAQSLLRTTEKSIQEIAADCGYNSIAHFSRQFKKATGLTPTSFRRNN